jgi:hypothetical protein
MSLVQYPRTPWWIRIVSLVGALTVAAMIVYLVFTFGWYASGLAALKEERTQREKTPIRLDFKDPNVPADPNGAP